MQQIIFYRRIKRFDVLKINGEKKLIVPLKPGETSIQCYVTNDKLLSIAFETYTKIAKEEEHLCIKICKFNAKILHM